MGLVQEHVLGLSYLNWFPVDICYAANSQFKKNNTKLTANDNNYDTFTHVYIFIQLMYISAKQFFVIWFTVECCCDSQEVLSMGRTSAFRVVTKTRVEINLAVYCSKSFTSFLLF